MDLSNFFQLSPIPTTAMSGTYNYSLVALSYFLACLASFVALDIAERIRTTAKSQMEKLTWLVGGAFTMGMGIWTMHFVGMLAFSMSMPMTYDLPLTTVSLVIAIIASAFAFFLIKNDQVTRTPLIAGGILLGLGIASMHYVGMLAMRGMTIHYLPNYFILSIIIAIVASEAALCLMIYGSRKKTQHHGLIKIGSALVMGFAICGMHYTGMAAAIFTHSKTEVPHTQSVESLLDPNMLSLAIAGMTLVIMAIALIVSRLWMQVLAQRAEQAKAEEAKIRAILTAAGDSILVLNQSGTILMCNRAVLEALHYTEDSMLGHSVTEFLGQISEQKTINKLSLSELIEKCNTVTELVGITKALKPIPIELSISRSHSETDDFYILVFRDISERKRIQENLNELNQRLMVTARQAGMAEVATCILHNIGNVLNSVNISTQLLIERSDHFEVESLTKLAELLKTNEQQLSTFLEHNPIGKMLPNYMQQLSAYWKEEKHFISSELTGLNAKIQHIKNIVVMQQSLSKNNQMDERLDINSLLEDAILINSIEKHGINIHRDYSKIPECEFDKVKILQILINLIKNSLESLLESKVKEKTLLLRTKMLDSGSVQIEVTDNGLGISQENISKIFSYGFTTKAKGHGFGLHPSALAAQECGGSLTAHSSGPGEGATFVLLLPLAKTCLESV